MPANQRPPGRGSSTATCRVSAPMECVRGHQLSNPSVKPANARSTGASTVTLRHRQRSPGEPLEDQPAGWVA